MNKEMSASDLLLNAATLIDRALVKLDTSSRDCSGCGRKNYTSLRQGLAVEHLKDVPAKLQREARQLEGI